VSLGTIGSCLCAERCTLELLLCAVAGGTATRPNRSFMASSLCGASTQRQAVKPQLRSQPDRAKVSGRPQARPELVGRTAAQKRRRSCCSKKDLASIAPAVPTMPARTDRARAIAIIFMGFLLIFELGARR